MPDTVGVGTRIIALLSTTVLTFPDWLSQLLNRSFSRTKSYSLPVFQAIGQPFHLAGRVIYFLRWSFTRVLWLWPFGCHFWKRVRVVSVFSTSNVCSQWEFFTNSVIFMIGISRRIRGKERHQFSEGLILCLKTLDSSLWVRQWRRSSTWSL